MHPVVWMGVEWQQQATLLEPGEEDKVSRRARSNQGHRLSHMYMATCIKRGSVLIKVE
jgi:hypothetical protein